MSVTRRAAAARLAAAGFTDATIKAAIPTGAAGGKVNVDDIATNIGRGAANMRRVVRGEEEEKE